MNEQAEKNAETPAGAASALTDVLGAAVIVRGVVVAWFADFTEEAREWCTENHFGEWLTWRAKPPEIVPLTEAEYDQAMRAGAELAAKLNILPGAPNVEFSGTPAALSPEAPLERRVGPGAQGET